VTAPANDSAGERAHGVLEFGVAADAIDTWSKCGIQRD
jgi:hypothetical protein